MITDYAPGDEPVPVGTMVHYERSYYKITDHADPETHPNPPTAVPLAEAYPDGTAYHLWPVGVPQKMGNRVYSRLFVRRTSFRVAGKED